MELVMKIFKSIKNFFTKKNEPKVLDMSDSIKLCNQITEKFKSCYKAEGYYDICSHCENWKYIDKENKLGYCTNKDDKKFATNTEKITGCSKFEGTENYKRLMKTIDNCLGLTNELRTFFRSVK